MKTYKIFMPLVVMLLVFNFSFAQKGSTKKETIKVWGECGMCKKTIEGAAKKAGASTANWDTETKVLAVSYSTTKTNAVKIQQAVAKSGYDTEKFTASQKAYDNLHECCKYERKDVTATSKDEKKACCAEGKDGKECKHHDGAAGKCCDMEKCGKDKDACKDMACCKDKEMKCCKHEGQGTK
jgi:periplasmic mercuric ion binding protein